MEMRVISYCIIFSCLYLGNLLAQAEPANNAIPVIPKVDPDTTRKIVRAKSAEDQTIDRAILDLSSGDVEIRRGAVMLLAKYNSSRAQKAVIDALNDSDPKVRFAAVVSVVEWRFPSPYRPVANVLELIDDSFIDIRRAVSSAIMKLMQVQGGRGMVLGFGNSAQRIQFSPSLRKKLESAFRDEDEIVRRNMLTHYRYLGFAVDHEIFADLMHDSDPQVRLSTLPLASQVLPLPLFIDRSIALIDDEERLLRLNLSKELGQKRSTAVLPLLKRLAADEDREISYEARVGAFQINPIEAEFINFINEYKGGLLKADLMKRVIQMLPYLGASAPEHGVKLLDIESSTLREAVVQQLFQLKVDVTHPDIIAKLINDDSSIIRSRVINHYRINPDQYNAQMLEGWIESEHKDVRLASIDHMSRMDPELASNLIFDLLIDDELQVRIKALNFCAAKRLKDYKKTLELTLQDENTEIQKQAVRLIMQMMGEEGIVVLRKFMEDNSKSPLSAYINNQLRARGYGNFRR